jgi:hypothetical protein
MARALKLRSYASLAASILLLLLLQCKALRLLLRMALR